MFLFIIIFWILANIAVKVFDRIRCIYACLYPSHHYSHMHEYDAFIQLTQANTVFLMLQMHIPSRYARAHTHTPHATTHTFIFSEESAIVCHPWSSLGAQCLAQGALWQRGRGTIDVIPATLQLLAHNWSTPSCR